MNITPRPRQPGEVVFSYLLLLFSLFVFTEAYKISGFSSVSSAGVFPMGAAAVMVFTSLIITISVHRQAALQRKPGSSPFQDLRQKVIPADILVFTALLVAYTVILNAFGFLVSSFLFLFFSIAYLHRKSLVLALTIAAGSLALIYVLFRVVFTVVLPKGWLFQ